MLNPSKVYSVDEVAKLLDVTNDYIRECIKIGRLHGAKIGKGYKILGTSVIEMLKFDVLDVSFDVSKQDDFKVSVQTNSRTFVYDVEPVRENTYKLKTRPPEFILRSIVRELAKDEVHIVTDDL